MVHRGLGLCLFAGLIVSGATGRLDAQQTSFSLADALTLARERSPVLAAERARLDAARRARERIGPLPDPVVEFRSENWTAGSAGDAPALDTYLTVTQPLDLGGRREARRAALDARISTAEVSAASAAERLMSEVAVSYGEAVRQRDRHRVLEAYAGDVAELVRVVERRVAAGTVAEADLLRMQTEEARAAVDATSAELDAARAFLHLRALLGGAGPLSIDTLVRPCATAPEALDVDQAIERRADVQAAHQAVESARSLARIERVSARPDAAVESGLKRTADVNTGVLAVTMAVPLFDRNRVARTLAEGQVTASEHELDAVRALARADIAARQDAARRLAGRATAIESQLVEPARGARDAARAAFASGALDIVRLLDAERAATEAALLAIDVQVAAAVAGIEARLATGRDPLP
jgi:cobalt-zinc-cadmium efflux system outer membrane protein